MTRLKYDHEELASFKDFPTWRRDFSLTYYRKGAAFLSLISADPDLLKGVDKEKLVAFQKASHTALKEYSDGIMASKVTWLVAAVPSHKWASILFPEKSPTEAYTALEEAILKASRSDGPAPLEAWDNHLNDLKKRRQWLTDKAFKALHYKNDRGTDLTVGLPKHHIWQGGTEESAEGISFNANIPTEEVFTAPHCRQVDGIVYSTKPLVYQGNLIDRFSLTFKDGQVVDFKADVGQDILATLLDSDDGARRLGEAALIPYNSPISQSNMLFYETLFDENASCHFALGKAYPTCLAGGTNLSDEEAAAAGLNDSMVHVDFMIGSADMIIEGLCEDGKIVPIFINGNWAN